MCEEGYSADLICEESDTEFDNLSIHSNSNDNHISDQDELLNIDEDNTPICSGIKPYNFERYLSDQETCSENSDTVSLDVDIDLPSNCLVGHDIQRLQNTQW